MCKRNNSALFFTCSLIEQIGRTLHAGRGAVTAALGEKGVRAVYDYADVLHCDPIEKAAYDTIAEFDLPGGSFDNVASARYTVPDVWTMGKVYARLLEAWDQGYALTAASLAGSCAPESPTTAGPPTTTTGT